MVRSSFELCRRAMTLVEVLSGTAILVLLALVVVPEFVGTRIIDELNPSAAQIAGVTNDIERFKLDCGRLPKLLDELWIKPTDKDTAVRWRGPYLKAPAMDPWGRPLFYRVPGVHNAETYDLWSLGCDGVDGTSDDITNWR